MIRFIVHVESKREYIYDNNKLKQSCYPNKDIENKWLAEYLDKAEYLNIVLDKSPCIFTGDYISHYQTIRTDGFWVWSSDFLHYTKNFNFIWPEDFMIHVKENLNNSNAISYDRLLSLGDNFSFDKLSEGYL
ncbi:hypothetical protein [uncultured Tenacibaculum sp.]|uniref:hypothetical protein n=1 Tax=uncultured Tenacibaculum sp. TaxID=174713 RepID=UPI0026203560|nr:hypothetical protein [uncultured Tenacibaculum sp.]